MLIDAWTKCRFLEFGANYRLGRIVVLRVFASIQAIVENESFASKFTKGIERSNNICQKLVLTT